MTLRNRVAVAAAAGVLIVVAAVSTVLFFSYAASLRSRVDSALVDAAQQASAIVASIKQTAVRGRSAPDFAKPVVVGSVEVQLFIGPVAAGRPTRFGPLDSGDVAVARHGQPAYFGNTREGGRQFRVYTAALPAGMGGGLVVASRAANADDAALRNAALLLGLLTIAATAVTYAAARLTAGRVLRPIAELTEAVEHVTRTGDLGSRLRRSAGAGDEVSRLAASFDAMLAALDESVTAQRQLVADASHELRTPLTSLTTNLDLLEDGAGVADPQAPDLVRAAREQAGELSQLITDLLDLASYHESGRHREAVRLDLLTSEAVHRMRQRAPHACIITDLQPCLVYVDPAGVDRAVCNLIDNAIKWTPLGGAVHVRVAGPRVSVTDPGPGIPAGDLPHIFERFYRAPVARGMPGSGLGLAIVASIAQANDATADVRTGPEGSAFTLTFPQYQPDTQNAHPDQRHENRVGAG